MSGRDQPVLSPADAMQRAGRAHEVGNLALAEQLCIVILADYAETPAASDPKTFAITSTG